MTTPRVRNLPDEVHRAPHLRTTEHGCRTEAEVRATPANAVNPLQRPRMGDALGKLGREIGLDDEDCRMFADLRDKTHAEPLDFE
jgi:plasmid stability protein